MTENTETKENYKESDVLLDLPDTFEIKHGEESLILKMTYKNLMRLAEFAQLNIERLPVYQVDVYMQKGFIDLIMSENNSKGELLSSEKYEKFKEDLTPEEIIDLYTWCGEHVNNFFTKRFLFQDTLLNKNKAIYEKRVNLLKQLGVLPQKTEKEEN